MNKFEWSIGPLTMLRELMLLEPSTGEDIPYEQLNKDNRDLYDAVITAIAVLQEKAQQYKSDREVP